MTGFPVLLVNVVRHLRRYNGVGDGNPLLYSCLENPMGRGAWWTIVHRVEKSWALLSDWAESMRLGFKMFGWKAIHILKKSPWAILTLRFWKSDPVLLFFFPSNMPFSEMWVARIRNFWQSPKGSTQGNHKDVSAGGVTAFTCDLQNSTTQPFLMRKHTVVRTWRWSGCNEPQMLSRALCTEHEEWRSALIIMIMLSDHKWYQTAPAFLPFFLYNSCTED